MRVTQVVYCKDCPIPRLCRDEGHECEYTRWVHQTVAAAPPLSRAQINTVVTLLATAKRPGGKAHSRHHIGPFKCQVPGCVAPPLKQTATLWAHVRGVHQITMAEYREKYGAPVALTDEELAELEIEAKCKVKGCGAVYSTTRGNRFPHQALISHLRGRHGLKPDGKTPVR